VNRRLTHNWELIRELVQHLNSQESSAIVYAIIGIAAKQKTLVAGLSIQDYSRLPILDLGLSRS
jgi:hypothetical protein